MKMRFVFVLLLISILSINIAYGAGIGISPNSMEINVIRGMSSEKQFTVFNPNNEETAFNVEKGKIDWINAEPSTGMIGADEYRIIRVKAAPPAETSNANYSSSLQIRFLKHKNVNRSSLSILPAVELKINAAVSGEQVIDAYVYDIRISDGEANDFVILNAGILNKGNVIINPDISMEISKDSRYVEVVEESTGEILPGKNLDYSLKIETDEWGPGKYEGYVLIDYGNEDYYEKTIPFRVFPEGFLKSMGNITCFNVTEGDRIIKIESEFINQGERNLNARLVVEFYRKDKLVSVLESHEKLVPIGEKVNFILYYKPEKRGSYKVISKVVYGNKESEAVQSGFYAKKGLSSVTGAFISDISTRPSVFIAVVIIIMLVGVGVVLRKRNKSLQT